MTRRRHGTRMPNCEDSRHDFSKERYHAECLKLRGLLDENYREAEDIRESSAQVLKVDLQERMEWMTWWHKLLSDVAKTDTIPLPAGLSLAQWLERVENCRSEAMEAQELATVHSQADDLYLKCADLPKKLLAKEQAPQKIDSQNTNTPNANLVQSQCHSPYDEDKAKQLQERIAAINQTKAKLKRIYDTEVAQVQHLTGEIAQLRHKCSERLPAHVAKVQLGKVRCEIDTLQCQLEAIQKEAEMCAAEQGEKYEEEVTPFQESVAVLQAQCESASMKVKLAKQQFDEVTLATCVRQQSRAAVRIQSTWRRVLAVMTVQKMQGSQMDNDTESSSSSN